MERSIEATPNQKASKHHFSGGKPMIIAYFALLRERTVPNYAVPVQACPRMHDSQRAGTAPPQTEILRQTLSTGSVPNSGGQS